MFISHPLCYLSLFNFLSRDFRTGTFALFEVCSGEREGGEKGRERGEREGEREREKSKRQGREWETERQIKGRGQGGGWERSCPVRYRRHPVKDPAGVEKMSPVESVQLDPR